MVKADGYVQFKLCCGDYSGDVIARVFPNLSKEFILGIPWLVRENPAIDWATGKVAIQKGKTMVSLPLVH